MTGPTQIILTLKIKKAAMIIKSESTGAFSINGVIYAKGELIFTPTANNTVTITSLATSIRSGNSQILFSNVAITDIKPSAEGDAFIAWEDLSEHLVNVCFTGGGFNNLSALTITVDLDGATITNENLADKTVHLVLINDAPKNTGYTQPDGAGAFVFNDGTTVAIGQKVTFIFS